MANENVRALVNRVVTDRPDPWEHIQTVRIPERAHQKLIALAELTVQTKTSLASALLVAAIEDALDALPDEPVDDAGSAGLRTRVRRRAEALYKEVSERRDREDREAFEKALRESPLPEFPPPDLDSYPDHLIPEND